MGKLGLTVTLFLIGAGLNRETLRKVGIRPLLQGLTLWVIVGAGTLADLHQQRNVIENTHRNLLQSEGYVDRSVKTLRGMARR